MAKARQQYQADGIYIDKQAKEFSLAQEIIEKLDSIEPWAEKNFIQGIKVNGEAQSPDQNGVVSLAIPEVVDELNSTDNKSSLSARQGRILYNYIKDLQSLGKFLSHWNAAIGLPTTNPSEIPYEYHTGDYYIISQVGVANNYRPEGSSFLGTASSVAEPEEIKIGDFYMYDGIQWILFHSSGRSIAVDTSLSTSSTNPVENRVVTSAINLKANDADISIVGKTNNYNDLDNTPQIPNSLNDLTGTADDIIEGEEHLFLTATERTKLVNTTGTNTGDETSTSIMSKLGVASATTSGYLTSVDRNTFNDKGDMNYSDFNFQVKSGDAFALDLATTITPTSDFTVNLPADVKDGQEYILVVENGATAYTMTLGDGIDNPYGVDLALTAEGIDQFVFLARGGAFELQPAVLTAATCGDIITHNVDEFSTAAQGAKADTALQSGDNVSELINDAGYITDDYHDSTKQDRLAAGDNITIEERCKLDTQGPSPDGFHVPTIEEWEEVLAIFNAMGGSTGDELSGALKLPFAGDRGSSNASLYGQGRYGNYWSSSPYSAGSDGARCLSLASPGVDANGYSHRARGLSVRCFKDTAVVPTSSWRILYDGSNIETGGIFWDSDTGLISMSSDGQSWITISDKNLGATEVYNFGDTLTDANMGYMYQWGNNYGFPSTGTISNTSSTQVDASSYGPDNPYSSDTFVVGSTSWDSSLNDNLWGRVTQGQQCALTISAVAGMTSAERGDISGTLSKQTDLQEALDEKVNLGNNKVYDDTVVRIGKRIHGESADSSGHHIILDPNGKVSTYNVTVAGRNEATLGSGNLTLLENTVLGGDETTVISQKGITVEGDGTTKTYSFSGDDRIATLNDVAGYVSSSDISSIVVSSSEPEAGTPDNILTIVI